MFPTRRSQSPSPGRFRHAIRTFLNDEGGPTAVEYAVMLALILVACITIVGTLGGTVSKSFSTTNTALGS